MCKDLWIYSTSRNYSSQQNFWRHISSNSEIVSDGSENHIIWIKHSIKNEKKLLVLRFIFILEK